MFKPVTTCIGIIMLALAAGCASSPPSEKRGGGAEAITADTDSLREVSYEELFLDLHTELLRKIESSTPRRYENMALIEARSILMVAEEMYLEGNVPLAVQLLREADLLLRQTP